MVRRSKVKQVNFIKIGDPVWFEEERYLIIYFYADRKRCDIQQSKGIKKISGLLIADVEPVY